MVEEAAVVGLVGLGGLATHGRALLEGGPGQAARVIEPLLPTPVDHVLLQADLTAVAPGPLEEGLARDLSLVAHVESRGGATVYRFSEASVRHAFDVGWSASEVHEVLARVSHTEVPQALTYLVDDVARTFGTLRLGTAEAFLRSDDEAALAALVHDPRAASLRLRRIAPPWWSATPRSTSCSPGCASWGSPRWSRRRTGPCAWPARARTGPATPRAHHLGRAEQAVHASARTAATVTAIRSGDRASAVRPPGRLRPGSPPPRPWPCSGRRPRAARRCGSATSTTTAPPTTGWWTPSGSTAGWLRAFDHRSEEVRSYAVHRINSVRAM